MASSKVPAKRQELLDRMRAKIRVHRIARARRYILERKNMFQVEFYRHLENRQRLRNVLKQRYVTRPNKYRSCQDLANTFERDMDDSEFCWMNDTEFKQKYGMSKTSVTAIFNLIKHHPNFQRKEKGRRQRDGRYQLMLLLAFLRMEGAGMNNERGRQIFGVGSGSCENYRRRTMEAIYDCLKSQKIKWPDEMEKQEIAARFRSICKIPNVIEIADGTLLPLGAKPWREDFADFKGRKHLYSMSMLVINDDRRRIRYFYTGWPGSVHDQRVFANSKVTKQASDLFTSNEFLLGDSAYLAKPFMVTAYKKASGTELSREEELFNTALSKARITSEHTLGILKCRFPFLRSIRMLVRDGEQGKKDIEKIVKYITVCIILHNTLIDLDDEYDVDDDDDFSVLSDVDADNKINHPLSEDTPDDHRRNQIKNFLIKRYY